MYLALISLFTALTISGVAIYYSVIGLTAIFAAAAIPIMVMGVALEVAKLVATLWLHKNWKISPFFIKSYLTSAVIVLMFITSMGIFGFLSKAHMDQTLVSGDVTSKIAVYDEKIKIAKENIDANRKALKQMDEAVDQVMGRSSDEKGADKAVAVRRSQQKERARLQSEIASEQKTITALSEERAPIAAEVRKVEAEVGPIKYIAAFVYGDNPDANVLEKAVTWVIIIIVFVFDPLAVVLLLASQYSFKQYLLSKGYVPKQEEEVEEEVKPTFAQRLAQRIQNVRNYASDSIDTLKHAIKDPLKKKEVEKVAEGDSPTGPVVDVVATDTTVTESTLTDEQLVAEANAKLAEIEPSEFEFIEPVEETVVEKQPMQFAKFDNTLVGFEVPKVTDAPVPTTFANGKLNVSPVATPEEIEFELPVPIEQWNKMIEAAEAEVVNATAYPTDPFLGQQFSIDDKNYIYNGNKWVFTPVSGESKFQLLPELKEHIESRSYVQNEEQTESNLWQATRESVEAENIQHLSQEDYQEKVQQAIVRDLVKNIQSGNISIADLTEAETVAVEAYLQKGSDDGENNTNQSA